jgi:hypothetical protein
MASDVNRGMEAAPRCAHAKPSRTNSIVRSMQPLAGRPAFMENPSFATHPRRTPAKAVAMRRWSAG